MPNNASARTRYAVVGTGHRAEMYIAAIAGPHADVAELVAVIDANPARAEYAARTAERSGAARTPVAAGPDDLEQTLHAQRVDRVVIAAPDHLHAHLIDRCLRAGVDVVVEKPLTIDENGARTIVAAAHDTARTPVITFNYRYSPRNSVVKELVAGGAIGTVTSITFEWLLDTSHGADYFRRWHREKANSGGLLVHKSSHHFDLVNWWLNDVPARVFASGGLRFYGAENAAARGDEPRRDRGSSDASQGDPFALDLRANPRLKALYLDAEQHDGYRRDQSVFDAGITIEDNLAVIVDYEKGPTLSYSLNAHAPWEGYRVGINGTRGRIELEVVERGAVLANAHGRGAVDPSVERGSDATYGPRPNGERILVQPHWGIAEEVPIPGGGGDHGGGDALMLSEVLRGVTHDPLERAADYRDGLRSIAVGIAGNRSLSTGEVIRVEDLGVDISRHDSRGHRG